MSTGGYEAGPKPLDGVPPVPEGLRQRGGLRWLQQELDELERSDQAVAEARHRLDRLNEDFARYERHMAARRSVGKRLRYGEQR